MKYLPIAALVLAAGSALAQTPPPPLDNSLQALDADRDGSINRSEAMSNSRLTKQFHLLDANANGALEPAEFAQFELGAPDSTPGTPGAPGSPGTPGSPPSPGTPPSGATSPPSPSSPPPGSPERQP